MLTKTQGLVKELAQETNMQMMTRKPAWVLSDVLLTNSQIPFIKNV